jgi:integrase
MGTWYKTDFKGVRYRKHPTRKHGVQADRYYVLTYKLDGKTKTEAMGWASDGVKPTDAFRELQELKQNQRTGQGPRTLAEKRQEGKTEQEAKRKAREAEAKINVSFKKFFDEIFLPDAEARWKPETARKPKEHVDNWINPVTGNTPMRELDLKHIKKIRAKLAKADRSARTQQYVFRTFSMVWNSARDHGLVNVPCPTKSASFRLPKVDNERMRYLSLSEEELLLNKIKARSQQAHDIAVVSLEAGLRFSEIARLSWGCVDIETGVIHLINTKTKKDRDVPMTSRLIELFGNMQAGKPKDLVFPNSNGKDQKQVPSSFVRAVEDTKLNEGVEDKKMKVSFYTLRHTYASRIVQSGSDIYPVQRLLGHASPVTTQRYAKLSADNLKNAVEAMEQDRKIKQSNGKVVQLRKKLNQ